LSRSSPEPCASAARTTVPAPNPRLPARRLPALVCEQTPGLQPPLQGGL
jgi:hypothetical protein